ncbi:MAG: helix-turn-helix domain-containing protein [Spirosomataceae bacterium]
MHKSLINYKGLYGDHQHPLLPNFIHYEALETRSKMYDWEINQHLHTDLYQIFIIESGDGILVSEQNEVELNTPCMITIPSHTLHGFAFQPSICGEVITFSESFLENLFKNSPNVLLELTHLKHLSFENDQTVFDNILLLKNQIIRELYEENPEKQTVVQSLFHVFFISLYRFSLSLKTPIAPADNRTLQYFRTFQKSIKTSLQESKSIREYAKELNITTVHLNRICQSLVQKSALQVVHEHLINEAKKYLLNTTYTISEVSYFLNFKDPAYFTRLFKKLTGVSPSEFRKN